MAAIGDIARRHDVPIVEDNAHGLFGRYRGQALGTFGALATQSFHETKNVVCGEGGALVLNDRRMLDRAEIIREKGTNRSRFFRGQIDKYSWVDVGSSYVLSDLLAAFLFGQLERWREIQQQRQAIWSRYATELAAWMLRRECRGPVVPAECEQAFHMFYILCPTLEFRTRLIAHLRAAGVTAVFHYQPLHLSDVGRSFGGRRGDCPVTERVADQLVRLPMFAGLTVAEQTRVIDAIVSFEA